MKKLTKKLLLTVFSAVVLVLCLAITTFAADNDVSFKANADDDNTVIVSQTGRNGKIYLFLPSSADLTALALDSDADALEISADKGTVAIAKGETFDLTAICTPKNGEYTVTFADGTTLIIMKSANVRALFYVSDDPENKGRPWVDTSKSNKAKGNMSLVGTDGAVEHSDKITEIKARGNSTFTRSDKKAYQFKLDKKVDLINNNKNEANKKWILLANMFDATLIHNSITFRLAMDLDMPYTPNYEAVDLYFDGEYRGAYLLCEKTEVGSSRIDIDDTDKAIEDLNEDTDAYENPVVVTATITSKGGVNASANSKGSYKYVDGLIEPELPDGATHHAYLLELEFTVRYPDEPTGFVTNRNQCVLTKNPEVLTKDTGAYISTFWQEFEDAVYSTNGYNTKTGKYYYEYCDLDSLVKLYLINEFSKNHDGFVSSTYFYLPADEDILYAGPVWDFDPAYGSGGTKDKLQEQTSQTEYFHLSQNYLVDGLLKIESFRNAIKKTLNKQNGEFYLAVQNMTGENGYVYTMSDRIRSSQLMNSKLWDVTYYKYIIVHPGDNVTFENATKFMNDYIEERIDWLSDLVSTWNGTNYSVPTYPTSQSSQKENLSFFEKIIAFFQSIIDWIMNLFKF